jgi:hypothetical protein
MNIFRPLAAFVLTVACSGPGVALTSSLSVEQINQATQEGDTMYHRLGAYDWGNYLLKTYTDDVILAVNSPEVDGIAIGTPYERVRYESFLDSFQDMPLTLDNATVLADTLKNKVTFLIYTHSPRGVGEEEAQWQQAYHLGDVKPSDTREHSYLDAYKPATLIIGGHSLVAEPVIDGPYRDQFTLPTGGAEFRFLGVVKYTFDLSGVPTADRATLRFKDSAGKVFIQTANLKNLQ